MSYFDDASLVMIPSGYKDQKVYSVKPIDGSGDLTFSRASSATRVNSSGLVEKVRENLITYSEDLSNAAYTNDPTDGSVTITANYGVAPNGTNTADRVQITKGTVYSQIFQAKSVTAGVEYSFSLYLKSLSGTPTITILYNENGAVGKATLTSSWVRYTFTYNAPLTSTNYPMIALYGGDSASCDILVWGLQFETGVPTDYIATTSSAVSVGPVSGLPRLDYSGGASCPSLLLEPQRTNQILQSESFGSASWTRFNASISSNVSATLDPQGYYGADKLVEDSSSSFHDVDQVQTYTAAPHTISVFAKSAGRDHIFLQHFDGGTFFTSGTFNLANGTVSGSGSIVSYGNGWYRCSFTATTVSGTGKSYINLSNGTSGNYAGNGTDGVYLWGAQLEAGAYATSYIPTITAETRVADDCKKTSISSLIGQTAGTVFYEFTFDNFAESAGEKVLWYMKDGGSGERYLTITNSQVLAFVDASGGPVQANLQKSGLTVGTYKVAIAYANNDFVMYVNGTLAASDTSGTIAGFSTFGIQYYSLAAAGRQMAKQALLFTTRLSNADLATLTA